MVIMHLFGRRGRTLIRSLTKLNPHGKEIFRGMGSSIAYRSLSFAPSKVFPSEGNIIRILKSEIKYEIDNNPLAQVPSEGIPFIVKDKPGEQWMALERKYGKEDIRAEATMIDLGPDVDTYEEVGKDETTCTITLAIKISKGEGTPVMMIGCSVHPDEIVMDTVTVMEKEAESSDQLSYQGPDFKKMSEDLQNAFKDFLEERGINRNLSNFLYDYMLNKSKEEYLHWLQSVKSFIEKQNEI